jgi:solute carrier family 1 (high affinity glutamate transporter) protein 2
LIKWEFYYRNCVFSLFSALTLPMTMKCMEENNRLPEPVSKFVLPLGMTIHMNGSAMYYPMVTLFVAQMHGLSISFQLIITLM